MLEMLQAAGSRTQQCAHRRCFLPVSSAGKRRSRLRGAVIDRSGNRARGQAGKRLVRSEQSFGRGAWGRTCPNRTVSGNV
ncbi:hypothetical protein D7027_12440 [Ochrobactrum intermedium]|nr:hypothetical protein [Brucella intermedia]